MSKTRRAIPKSRKSNELEHSRKRLHKAQANAHMHDPIEPFVFRAGSINSGNLIFWVLFLNIAQAAYAGFTPDTEVFKLASKALTFDTRLSQEEAHSGACDNIVNRVTDLAARNDLFKQNILHMLRLGNFRLICSNREKINKGNKKTLTTGFFLPGYKSIIIPHDLIRDNALNHETIHAKQWAEHQANGNCPIKEEIEMSVPIHPFNNANAAKFDNCMNLGRARLIRIAHLRRMKLNDRPLTKQEEYDLARAKKMLQGTLPGTELDRYSYAELHGIDVSAVSNEQPMMRKKNGNDIKIFKIEDTGDDFLIYFTYVDPIMVLYNRIENFDTAAKRGDFKTKSLEASERLAYYTESLDLQGRLYIFPELVALLEEQEAHCRITAKSEL